MPRYNFTQTEQPTLAELNSANNTVVIPIYVNDATLKTKYYIDVDEFIKDYTSEDKVEAGKVAYQSTEETETGKVPKEKDYSYYMAKTLLGSGLGVVVKPIYIETGFDSEAELCEDLNTRSNLFDEFKSRNNWDIKFLTTGAHANLCRDKNEYEGIYTNMVNVAAERGDAVALVELEDIYSVEDVEENTDIFDLLREYTLPADIKGEYAACYYPWGEYSVSGGAKLVLPGCFGYLSAFANSIQLNKDWVAAAGTLRGYIPGLVNLNYAISDSVANAMLGEDGKAENQTICINPIMKVGTYGDRVWGNRTFKLNQAGLSYSYSNFMNVRILCCDIKKRMYDAAVRVTYEPNDIFAWNDFKALNNDLLDEMVNNRGLSWYTWTKLKTVEKATIKANLTIKPIEAVENFDINITLTDSDVAVTEPNEV